MIVITLLLLWALFICAVLTYIAQQVINGGKSLDFKNFEAVEIPYVTIDIQGNLMNMVVDTGCAVSLLNIPSISNCELMYKKSGKSVNLSAITSDRVNSDGITIDFNVGKKKVTEDFYLQNTDDFGNFNTIHGITLHGLLGSSFFEKNNCKIDFKTHQLIIA